MDIKIVVAAHKPYQMPRDDMYLPVYVGAAGKEDITGYVRDDTGENISEMNSYLCELTGTYWAWKNLKADVIGVAHYRRHFSNAAAPIRSIKSKWSHILDKDSLKQLLRHADIIVPNKRRYWIETNEGHYSHTSQYRPAELQLMRAILREDGGLSYIQAFETVLRRRWAHMFNMYIMTWERFDQFNQWQFDRLFRFEKRLDRSSYPPKENRAWIEELMIDTWLEANRLPYAECPVMFMEKQNWIVKGGNMVLRKIRS